MAEPTKTLAEIAAEQGIRPVADPDELAAPPEHLLTDEEFEAWQDAIHGRREQIGGMWDAPESSPYARLKAYAEGGDTVASPSDVRELLTAFNATDAMLGVAKRTADNHRRRVAAIRVLADTDDDIDPEALRRALAIGTRDEHAAAHPSTAQFRQWIVDLQEQLEDAREEDEPDPAAVYGGDLTPPLCCCRRGLMCARCGTGQHWQCPDRDDQDDDRETSDEEEEDGEW